MSKPQSLAVLKLKDVLNPDLSVVQQVNLKAAQTKGSKVRTVVLNDKMRKELCRYLKTRRLSDLSAPVIASQRTGKHFSNTTLCMQFSSFYKQAGMRNTSHAGRRTFATKLNAQGVGMRTIQLAYGASAHRNHSTLLRCHGRTALQGREPRLISMLTTMFYAPNFN